MTAPHVDKRRTRYQHRRPELLALVTDHVLAQGSTGLAMRPLAAAIGVSHGTLLHHFGTKENLVTEVIELLHDRLAAEAGLAAEPYRLSNLSQWWRRTTDTDRIPVYRVLFEVQLQAARQPERYERFLRRSTDGSLRLLTELARADGCPPERAPVVASMIMAQARGLQLDLLVADDRVRIDRAFELFIELLGRLRNDWRQAADH